MTFELLEATALSKGYRTLGGFRWIIRDVSAGLGKSDSLGIAGPSGAGKSTLARILCGIERPTGGSVCLNGKNILKDRRARRKIQMIWQDPAASLNPYMTAYQLISEPLEFLGDLTRKRRRQKALELSHTVGLDEGLLQRRPLELSGGQCARTAAARALAADPFVLVCDESFSSLDVPAQEDFMAVLQGLVRNLGISIIIISHDLFPIKRLCRRTAIVHEGRIVEAGMTSEILSAPRSPWAREMISSLLPWPFKTYLHQRPKPQ